MPREIEHLKGLDLIVEERLRQVDKLGYTIPHDHMEHSPEILLRVGACYADFAANEMEGMEQDEPHPFWPESSIPWRREESPMENAIKGAAFIAAALDLLYAQIVGDV